MSTIERSTVHAGEKVTSQGGNVKIKINGDVFGTVIAQGSNATVRVSGYIHAGARVIAQGSNASVKYHGRHRDAQVTAQGSNAEEVDLGRKSDSAWRETMRVKERIWREGAVIPAPIDHDTSITVQKSARPREQWGT